MRRRHQRLASWAKLAAQGKINALRLESDRAASLNLYLGWPSDLRRFWVTSSPGSSRSSDSGAGQGARPALARVSGVESTAAPGGTPGQGAWGWSTPAWSGALRSPSKLQQAGRPSRNAGDGTSAGGSVGPGNDRSVGSKRGGSNVNSIEYTMRAAVHSYSLISNASAVNRNSSTRA